MKDWTCIIIDDEEHAIGILEEIIQKIPGLILVKTFIDGLTAVNALKEEQVDLVFSDIDMPKINGLETAKLLKPYCRHIIFTTAHDRYALEAFMVNADGYLMKPLRLINVMQKVELLREKDNQIWKHENAPPSEHLFVKAGTKGAFIKIAYSDIICIDSDDHFINLITKREKIMVYLTMKEMEAHLKTRHVFKRISKSCIISLAHLERIDGNRVYLDLTGIKTRDIGDTYRSSFLQLINKLAVIPQKR